jgi:hypothetical protein
VLAPERSEIIICKMKLIRKSWSLAAASDVTKLTNLAANKVVLCSAA